MRYTKEDIVGAALLRFAIAKAHFTGEALIISSPTRVEAIRADLIDLEKLENMFNDFYDKHGKDTFRKYASVDADCMKQWKIYNDK